VGGSWTPSRHLLLVTSACIHCLLNAATQGAQAAEGIVHFVNSSTADICAFVLNCAAVPMKKYGNCDFSYAGLKTSVRLCIEKVLGSAEGVGKRATNEQQSSSGAEPAVPPLQQQPSPCSGTNEQQQQQQQQQLKADIAASFQRVAVEHLAMRLRRAVSWAREEAPELQHLVVAGGVASNQYVRQQITQVRHLACLE